MLARLLPSIFVPSNDTNSNNDEPGGISSPLPLPSPHVDTSGESNNHPPPPGTPPSLPDAAQPSSDVSSFSSQHLERMPDESSAEESKHTEHPIQTEIRETNLDVDSESSQSAAFQSATLSPPTSLLAGNPRKGQFQCVHSCCTTRQHIFRDRSNWLKHINHIPHLKCDSQCSIHRWREQYDSVKKRSGNKKRKATSQSNPSPTTQPAVALSFNPFFFPSFSSLPVSNALPPQPTSSTSMVSSLPPPVSSSSVALPYQFMSTVPSSPFFSANQVDPILSSLFPPSNQSVAAGVPIASPASSSFLSPHRVSMLGPMSDVCVFDDTVRSSFHEHGHVVFTPFITQDPVFTASPILDFDAFTKKKYSVYSLPFRVVNLEARPKPIKKTFEDYYTGRLPLDTDGVLAMLKKGDAINFYQKDADFKDERVSVYHNARGVKKHPMNLNSIAKHPRSLLSLVDFEHRGFDSVYGYHKQFIDHFNAHFEQVKGPFLHHVIKGKIRWYMIPPTQLQKLKAALVKLIKAEVHIEQTDPGLEDMLLVLFVAKQIFPPPSFLRAEGVELYSFDLVAGECLYMDGDWVHFGFNQAPHSISLAVNVLSEVWLKTGPRFVRDHLQWLERVRDNKSNAIQSNPVFERILSSDNLHDCFNVCPHGWTCHLFTRLSEDIHAFLEAGTSKFQYELPREVLQTSLGEIKEVIVLLHKLKKFYSDYNEAVCDCDASSNSNGA